MMKLKTKSFSIHKEAESPDDCQDAWSLNDGQGRYAIADGATRSFFPKEWATLLVEHFCESTDWSLAKTDWQNWIAPIQQKWHEQVEEKVIKLDKWYITNSFNTKKSAASTFIGLEFNKDSGTWEAMIVGDSCLFHKSDIGLKRYLIENSADFTDAPDVFASFDKDNHFEPTFIHGSTNPGDTFILVTDALAKWILEHREAGELDSTLNVLETVETDEQFHQFVHEARHKEVRRLVNDDVTLMLISVGEAQEQLDNQETEQRPSVEDTKSQSKLSLMLLLAMVTVFFGFAAFCYILLYLFNRD